MATTLVPIANQLIEIQTEIEALKLLLSIANEFGLFITRLKSMDSQFLAILGDDDFDQMNQLDRKFGIAISRTSFTFHIDVKELVDKETSYWKVEKRGGRCPQEWSNLCIFSSAEKLILVPDTWHTEFQRLLHEVTIRLNTLTNAPIKEILPSSVLPSPQVTKDSLNSRRRGPGRPTHTDIAKDKEIYEQWKSFTVGQMKDFALQLNIPLKELRKILDRQRKRLQASD